jgi:alpha-beta hydrolase superfamily lysophospholipase
LSNPFLNTTMAASSSNASSVLMGRLHGINKSRVLHPRVPYASEMVPIGDIDCRLNTYDPDRTFLRNPPKALVLFLHGLNAHGTFPTTRIVADLMVANGYAFMAPDLPGHGLSSGLRGYIESGDKMIDFATTIAEHAFRVYVEGLAAERALNGPDAGNPGMKLFMIGSSLGGNLSLQVATRRTELVSGVILMAPMLKISLVSPFLTRLFIKHSSTILHKAEAIPLPKDNNYRCPKVAEECHKDMLKPLKEGDKARLGTIQSLFELEGKMEANFDKVGCPCLAMVGDEDDRVNNQGAVDLCRRARSQDMTLKRYPAKHGLMGEPSPLLETIQYDMIRWLDERCNMEVFIRSSL